MNLPASTREPPRLRLARLPTPLERLDRTSERLGLDLWVKRDDLTGIALSGNKVRKLEYLFAEAEARGATAVVTCGGVNSNHARATAVAAARRGLSARLLLRGQDRHPPTGNLLLDRLFGAEIHFCDDEGWLGKDAQMAELAGADGYVIPEGGSNGLGALGYVRAAAELAEQAHDLGMRLGRVVHGIGSGGTTAGLALGFSALGLDVDVVAVAVMKDSQHFDPIVARLVSDATSRGFVDSSVAAAARWRVLDGYVGGGYAATSAAEMDVYAEIARKEGLVLDPVYTGKAFLPLARGALPPADGATVFLHTGGIFELFAYAPTIERLHG